MKKLFLSFLLFILIAKNTYSAPCYGSKMPEKGQIFFGIQNYTVMKRYLDKDYGNIDSMQEFILISYGLLDWLTLDLKGGAGRIIHHSPIGAEKRYPTFMAGGYGLRINLYEKEKIKTVLGLHHISVHPYSIEINNTKYKAVLDNWQVSLLASCRFNKITPYIGIKFSRMDYINWIDGQRKLKKSEPDKNLGCVIGMDIPINKHLWFNVECQMIDVTAIATSLNFHF